ncbi:MAG: hypothetical protein WC565_04175 [Parcubacteria group bacterium]
MANYTNTLNRGHVYYGRITYSIQGSQKVSEESMSKFLRAKAWIAPYEPNKTKAEITAEQSDKTKATNPANFVSGDSGEGWPYNHAEQYEVFPGTTKLSEPTTGRKTAWFRAKWNGDTHKVVMKYQSDTSIAIEDLFDQNEDLVVLKAGEPMNMPIPETVKTGSDTSGTEPGFLDTSSPKPGDWPETKAPIKVVSPISAAFSPLTPGSGDGGSGGKESFSPGDKSTGDREQESGGRGSFSPGKSTGDREQSRDPEAPPLGDDYETEPKPEPDPLEAGGWSEPMQNEPNDEGKDSGNTAIWLGLGAVGIGALIWWASTQKK